VIEVSSLNFLFPLAVGLFLAGGTFWLARKSGLQPAQAALIDTLQDNAVALKIQVDRLKEEVATQRDRRVALERKVARMEAVILSLADENSVLRAQLGMQPRRHPIVRADLETDEGGE
jgi:hypothetical protein